MTKEQIEEVRRMWHPARVVGAEVVKDIDRLLEERERLLQALRRSHDAMATWFSSEYTEHTTALNAKAAIAFAEAPAD